MPTMRMIFDKRLAIVLLGLLLGCGAFAQFQSGLPCVLTTVVPCNQTLPSTPDTTKYFSQNENSVSIRNVLELKINELATTGGTSSPLQYFASGFTAKATISVRMWANISQINNPPTDTETVSLTVNYDPTPGNKYAPIRYLVLSSSTNQYQAVQVVVDSVTVTGLSNGWTSSNVLPLLLVQNEMQVERYFTLSDTVANLAPTIYYSFDSVNHPDQLSVNWTFPSGANNNLSQLEYAWVENETQGYYTVGGVFDTTELFQDNSTRIDIDYNSNSYNIPLLYDADSVTGGGILYYRVRAVEVSTDGNIIAGPWSGAKTFATEGHEFHLNWQATTDFAENAKSKSVIQYYDGTLRPRQTVTKDNSTGNTIVGQTIYDLQGRPNVQILPTPTNGKAIQFFTNFNKFVNEPGFTVNPAEYFDLSLPGMQGTAGPALDTTTISNGATGSGAYYSANNPFIDSERTANFIPDAAGYAYTETRYTDDPTQRVSVQGGVGLSHQIGNGHTTNYFYGQPTQNELDALFGTEAGNATHYFKNMVQDANGQMSVTYVDMHGRTVATALTGAGPGQMTNISSNTAFYPARSGYLTDSLLTQAGNVINGDSIQSTSTILVATRAPYTFTYQLNPAILQLANANHQPVCFDCKYNLEISFRMEGMGDSAAIVKDFNNLQLVPSGQSCAVSEGFVGPGYTSPVTQISFTDTLGVGSWVVRKTLTINDSIFQLREDSALNTFLVQTQQSISDSVFNAMSTASQCAVPEATQTCTACQAQLGSYATFKANYLSSLPSNTTMTNSAIYAIFTQDSLNCANACGLSVLPAMTTLGQLREQLLADMMPYGGQYALPLDSLATDTLLTAKYNIFTPTYTGSFGAYSGTKPYFRNPVLEPNGAPGTYLNDGGMTDPAIYPLGNPDSTSVLNTVSPDSFATIFNTDWAEQLIVYHPEYKKLHFAETVLWPEFAWLDEVRQINSEVAASDSGYLTPLTNDPYFTANSNTGVVPADRDTMNIRLFHTLNSSDTSTFSIWQLANGSVLIDTAVPQPLRGMMIAGLSKTGIDASAGTQAQKDAIWQSFRDIYFSYRNDMVMNYINTYEQDTLTPAAMTELQNEGRTLHFVTQSGLAAQNGWSWWTQATNPGSVDSAALADSANAYVAANTVNTCTAERALWQGRLEQCEVLQQYLLAGTHSDTVLVDTIVNAILDGMVQVCQLSIDAVDPEGASNVNPANLPADPASFEQVVDSVFAVYGIDTLPGTHQPYYFCNPYSVDYPKPYQLGPPLFATYSPTVDSCNCVQWAMLKATAASAGYDSTSMHSMNTYLETNYNDSLSLTLWTGLQTCSGRVSWDTSYFAGNIKEPIPDGGGDSMLVAQYDIVPQYIGLSATVEIPQFLSCGYVKPCITCTVIDTLTARFRLLFPNFANVPFTDSTMDTTEAAQNALWARYLNYKTGFSLTANDYAAAYLNCGLDTAIEGNLVLTDRTTQAPAGAGVPYTYIAKNTVSFESGYSSNTGDEFQTSLGDSAAGSTVAMCALAAPVTYVPSDTTGSNPCQSIQDQANYIGQLLFGELQDSLVANFDSLYLAKCLGAQRMETFYATYQPTEYHYTLYYYDQAGNLLKTLPPDGVIPNYSPSYFAQVAAARAANRDMTNGMNIEGLATQYRYNTLNQVIAQQTPDAGTSQFWYDRLGRLAVSQNAKQADSAAYSYTEYDVLGRITEVGQKPQTTVMTQTISQDTTTLASWLADLSAGGPKIQITRTVYDTAYVPLSGTSVPINGSNLRNRVAYTMVIDQENTNVPEWRAATFYSYDPHGDVDTLMQDYGPNSVMGQVSGNRFKLMTYDYDLITGKVNQVSYQPGKADAFYHQYSYDAENRIVGVSTSRDSIEWENDASYTYYRHGPLARVELGSLQLQGVDYAYTLQGWLKSINPSWITPGGSADQYDSDGVSTIAYFERDAYKLNLNYFDDGTYADFKPVNPLSGYVQGNALSSGVKRNLYNGNIASQAINIRQIGVSNTTTDGGPMIYNYGYDQLNRISSMDAWAANGSFQLTGSSALADYAERYSYDPNGNILTLSRNGAGAGGTPPTAQLSYKYLYTNTSGGVGEYVPGSAPTSGVSKLTNQLSSIQVVGSGGTPNPNELPNQPSFNYQYNEIGQLTKDTSQRLSHVVWNVYGKILSLVDSGNTISFTYDAAGNRISKTVHGITTWYVRDAQGNVMSVYTQGNSGINSGALSLTEAHLYGSSRLGLLNLSLNCTNLTLPDSGSLVRGNKLFELTNHLGNVLETISDKKIQHTSDNSTVDYYVADVIGANDYYSFGMAMPGRGYAVASSGNYRYGFNGKEDDNEVKGIGNEIDYGKRAYDPRVARFLTVDPLTEKYAMLSPYQYASNSPVGAIDVDGMEGSFLDDYRAAQNRLIEQRLASLKIGSSNSVLQTSTIPVGSIHQTTLSSTTALTRQDFQRIDNQNYQAEINENLQRGADLDPVGAGVGRMLVTTPMNMTHNIVTNVQGINEGIQNGRPGQVAANALGLVLNVVPFIPFKGVGAAAGEFISSADEIFSTSISTRGLAEQFALTLPEYTGYKNANILIQPNNPVFDLYDNIGNVVDVTTTNASKLTPTQFYSKIAKLGELDNNLYKQRMLQIFVKDGQYSSEQISQLDGKLNDYIRDFNIQNTSFTVTAIK